MNVSSSLKVPPSQDVSSGPKMIACAVSGLETPPGGVRRARAGGGGDGRRTCQLRMLLSFGAAVTPDGESLCRRLKSRTRRRRAADDIGPAEPAGRARGDTRCQRAGEACGPPV